MTGAAPFVYLDTSVALAHLLSDSERPPDGLWREALVSCRLLEYEMWSRIHAMGLGTSHRALVEALLTRVSLVEIVRPVVSHLTAGFARPLRTLDALHLAAMLFLREQGVELRLASYDQRLSAAAEQLGFESYRL